MRAEESQTAEALASTEMESHDWSQTPLGASENWSDELKTAVQRHLTELAQAKPAAKTAREIDLPQNQAAAVLLQVAQANAFRVRLADALRPLTDATEIQALAARILGETLGATRVIYIEVVSDGEEVVVHRNYTNGVAQLSGRYRLEDYRRNLTADHRAGQTQIVTDIPNHPDYTDAEKARYREIDIAAHIDVPLIKNNQFVALLAIHQSTPRQWAATEVKLVEETAEQTWAAVERARAEGALRESEARLAVDLAGMRRLYNLYATLATELDLKTALDEILAVACEFTQTERGCVQFVSDDGTRLEMFTWRGYSDDSPFINHFRYEGFKQGCDQVRVAHQRSIIEETIGYLGLEGTEAGAAAAAEGIRAAQSTPIVNRRGEAIGVLSTQFSQPHRPSDDALKLVDLLAWTAGSFVERYRSYTALRESEEQYCTLFESIDEGFCVVEVLFDAAGTPVDHRILQANPAFERQTGITNPEGKVASELAPGFEQYWNDLYTQVINTGESVRVENRSDALDRWFDVLVSRVGDAAMRRVAIAFSDISARKLAEAALREKEDWLRLALKTGKLGAWQLDLKTNQLFTSDQCKVNYGFLPEANFTHQALFDRIHPDDRAWVQAAVQQAIEQHTDYEAEYRTVWDDNSIHWALVRGSTVYDDDGTPLHMVGMSLDITDRKRAEAALQESESRFRNLADNIAQFAWMANETGWIFWYNQRWFDYTGTTLEEMQGWGWQQLHHPDRVERVVEHFRHCLETGEDWEDTFPLRGKDGKYRWFLSRAIPIRDEQGHILRWFGTNTDISDRVQIERDRERILQHEQAAREEAERANRIKDEFLAVLSHELRSPLNPILGWTRLLQNRKLDAARQKEALAVIERNAKLQTQLIEDLLDISRIMQGKLALNVAPVSLTFVISAAVETVRLAAEAKKIEIVLDLDPSVAPVSGDAARLLQVVWNLLSNAVKFTPNNGQVTVELRQINQLAQIRVLDVATHNSKRLRPQSAFF